MCVCVCVCVCIQQGWENYSMKNVMVTNSQAVVEFLCVFLGRTELLFYYVQVRVAKAVSSQYWSVLESHTRCIIWSDATHSVI